MKSVLISILPKWCELIASGKKTVEVRKTKPKLETPFKVYIYATWNGKKCDILVKEGNKLVVRDFRETRAERASGKVIGEFVCDRIEEIGYSPYNHGEYICKDQSFIEQSCVPFDEMFDYLVEEYGYGWHISNLVIYDEPKALGDFRLCGVNKMWSTGKKLERPPQSWGYVEEVK